MILFSFDQLFFIKQIFKNAKNIFKKIIFSKLIKNRMEQSIQDNIKKSQDFSLLLYQSTKSPYPLANK